MKQTIVTLLIIISSLSIAQEPAKKVLMVVSSYGKDDGQTRPGYEFDELSQAYLVFKANGLMVEIASPKGGDVEADQYNKEKQYNAIFLQDDAAMTALSNTLSTASLRSEDYDALYVVGGKGAMFDLPFDPSLQDIILELYKRDDAILSAVCHGPAAFVNVKDGDRYIVENEKLTSFSNEEESLFGKKWVPEFPFMLETKLKERGAIHEPAPFMLSQVHTSGKFVTGQNPFSTAQSAEAVVEALGLTPIARELYPDEKSIYSIQNLFNGTYSQKEFQKALKANVDEYDVPLIAIYGYYTINDEASDEKELLDGLSLIELTSPYFFNENLQLVAAKTYHKLDQDKKAKEILNELIKKELAVEKAQALLLELN
ncbi:type 1 glutamine amidotransferase domain-containing protein [Ekhidna sp.]|uniref:type 1 glutamine amidotransferase domain-containing protein n=1 Tax=Ekhidna sp. TaxID=2608089 RepID=UPI003B5BEC01